MIETLNQITTMIPSIGGWTSVIKAHYFAAVVLAFRPEVCVEIGVWEGRGSLAVALALKEVGRGVLHSIDPWSPDASIEGQANQADVDHWKSADHEKAYQTFLSSVAKYHVDNIVKVYRKRSDQVEPPADIGFLMVDGNHGDAAITDVKRFAPNVRKSGICYLDDLDWSTGSVRRAEAQLKSMGFVDMYRIETGAMYQRI